MYAQVGESEGRFDDLVRYLTMARESLKERYIDTELVYSLAQVCVCVCDWARAVASLARWRREPTWAISLEWLARGSAGLCMHS